MGPPKIFNFWGEEKWRQAKLAREFLLASPFRRGTVATMTTTACRDLIRMRIMISNINGYGRKYLLYHSRFVFKCYCDMVCRNHVYGRLIRELSEVPSLLHPTLSTQINVKKSTKPNRIELTLNTPLLSTLLSISAQEYRADWLYSMGIVSRVS